MQFANESTLTVALQVLGLVALVASLLVGVYFARQAARKVYGDPRLVDRFTPPLNKKAEVLRGISWALMMALFAIVFFQPMGGEQLDKLNAGSTLIIGDVDVSWSMQVEDYRGLMPGSEPGSTVATGESGSRIDMAGYLITQMMQTAAGNKMGLVTYMGEGWPLFDPVGDFSGLRIVMDNGLFPGNAPGGGSDIARGLAHSIAMFDRHLKTNPDDKNMQQVIVLFSDGGFTGKPEDLQKVIDTINARKIRLVVVGLGSRDEKPIPIYDDNNGAFKQYRKIDAKESTAIDEKFLRKLADDTHGEYHYLMPGQTSLDIRWASALGTPQTQPHGKPLYKWFATVAFALLIINCFPGLSRKRTAG